MDISILIVTRRWDQKVQHFHYIKELKHSNIDFEVLIAEGANPSCQRNILAQKARGKYFLFLDDDSIPAPDLLEQYLYSIRLFPDAQIIGGPSVLLPLENRPLLYGFLGLFFSSRFGIGPVRCRYNSVGTFKKATEKDLILCNLLMERTFFEKTNGFNQDYYPGEENHFIKNLSPETVIYYDPQARVYRRPRNGTRSFLIQMHSYGKGRAKHLSFKHPEDIYYLVPVGFMIYLFILIFWLRSYWFFFPLLSYLLCGFFVTLKSKMGPGGILKILSPLFFFAGHMGYAAGIIYGLLLYQNKIWQSRLSVNRHEIRVHQLKNFKKCFT